MIEDRNTDLVGDSRQGFDDSWVIVTMQDSSYNGFEDESLSYKIQSQPEQTKLSNEILVLN